MKTTNMLLGLLAVAGVGGAYWLYTQNRRETSGIEVPTGSGTKWFYQQEDGTLSRADAIEIANFCRGYRNDSFGAEYRARVVQVLTSFGHPDLALTCSPSLPGL